VAREVLKEVSLLGRCTPHASLLPLLGYCLEASRLPCLVYPLCEGGTLEDRLLLTSAGFDRLAALGWAEPPAPLTWPHRLTILRDVARALAHLHAQQPVLLHGDVAAPSEGVAVVA
jgi:serine/threonine protein kinase